MNRSAGFLRCLTFSSVFFLCASSVDGAPTPKTTSCKNCNVILISFDTLRADRLGALGYKRPVTPHLDSLAKKSALFTNAVSPSAWTLPSIMSVFTSLYPEQHAVVNKYSVFLSDRKELARLPPQVDTLAEVFKRNRYRTAAFTGGAALAAAHGFGDGFAVYVDSATFGGFDSTLPMALGWVKRNKSKKFFMFVQGYDAHGQYEKLDRYESRFADPDYRGPFQGKREEFLDLRMKTIQGKRLGLSAADVRLWQDRYDEQVLRADERLGNFLDQLGSMGNLMERTVIVVIADHGEQFYEHGGVDHGMTLYEELIHVPFVLRVPGLPGKVIDSQVSLIDVMPTLADLLRLDLEPATRRQMQGTSVLPLLEGKKLAIPDAYSSTDFLLHTFQRSLRTADGWKLIYDLMSQKKELYYLVDDPQEQNDLLEKRPEVAYELEKKLHLRMREQLPYTGN